MWLAVLLRRADTVPLEDKEQVLERLDMWNNLLEQDPYIQKKTADAEARGEGRGEARGLAKGEARGEARGLEKGRTEGLQKAVLSIVRGRFPLLTDLAQEKVGRIQKVDALDLLLEQIVQAPDEAIARWLLSTLKS